VHLLLDEHVIATWERAPSAQAAQSEASDGRPCTVRRRHSDKRPAARHSAAVQGCLDRRQLVPWDLPSAHAYAQVMYTATDALFVRLTPEDLRHEIDLSAVGLG